MASYRLAGPVLAVMALLGGCGVDGVAPAAGVPPVAVRKADRDLLGPWTDRSGRVLPDGTAAANGILVVATSYGSTTCTRRNGTVFLHLAWPIGTEVDVFGGEERPTNTLQFIRDSTGSGMAVENRSDLDVTLPPSAAPTGFRREGNTISVDPVEQAVYVTRSDGTTERWARLQEGQGCA